MLTDPQPADQAEPVPADDSGAGESPARHVFLSHNSAERPYVMRLARDLEAYGVCVWLDRWRVTPGTPWEPTLREALHHCVVFLACVGEHGQGPWHEREIHEARLLRKPSHLVRLPGYRGATVGLEHLAAHVLTEENWDDDVQRLAIALKPLAPRRPTGARPSWDQGPRLNPYPGLESFTTADARWFIGRDADTHDVLVNLRLRRWLWLVGDSGCGKSSLARAGVIPWWINESDRLGFAIDIRPGADPALNFAARLGKLFKDGGVPWDLDDTAVVESQPERLVALVAEKLVADDARRWLIVIDQSEELLLRPKTDDGRTIGHQILRALSRLVESREQFHALLTLPSGSLPLINAVELPARQRSGFQLFCQPLEGEALRQAITVPAIQAGGRVDDAVVELLVDAAHGQAGSLPLVQLALAALWQNSEDHKTRFSQLREINAAFGVHDVTSKTVLTNVLRQQIREVEKELGDDRAERLSDLFHVLTAFDDDDVAAPRRRRVAWSSLAPTTLATAKLLARKRLLTRSLRADRTSDDEGWVEVAHETIFSAWPEWNAWNDENRARLRRRHRLERDAARWLAGGRNRDDLPRGSWLVDAVEIFDTLNPDARTYVAAAQEVQKQLDDAARRSARRKTLARRALGVAFFALCIAGGVLALSQQREAQRRAELAEHDRQQSIQRLLASRAILHRQFGELETAIALGVESLRRADHRMHELPAAAVLQDSLSPFAPTTVLRHSGPLWHLEKTRFGRDEVYISGGDDGTVGLFNARTRSTSTLGSVGESLTAIAVQRGTVITGDSAGVVRWWRLRDHQSSGAVHPIHAPIDTLAVCDDIVAFTSAGQLRLANSQTGTVVRAEIELADDWTTLRFSPNCGKLAVVTGREGGLFTAPGKTLAGSSVISLDRWLYWTAPAVVQGRPDARWMSDTRLAVETPDGIEVMAVSSNAASTERRFGGSGSRLLATDVSTVVWKEISGADPRERKSRLKLGRLGHDVQEIKEFADVGGEILRIEFDQQVAVALVQVIGRRQGFSRVIEYDVQCPSCRPRLLIESERILTDMRVDRYSLKVGKNGRRGTRSVITVDSDGQVSEWQPAVIDARYAREVNFLRFSPIDDSLVAVAGSIAGIATYGTVRHHETFGWHDSPHRTLSAFIVSHGSPHAIAWLAPKRPRFALWKWNHEEGRGSKIRDVEFANATNIAFTADDTLVAADSDGTLALWRPEGDWSGPPILREKVAEVMAVSADGQHIATMFEGQVRLWGARGEPLAEWTPRSNLLGMRFWNDPKRLYLLSETSNGEREVEIADLDTGTSRMRIPTSEFVPSHDGQWLAVKVDEGYQLNSAEYGFKIKVQKGDQSINPLAYDQPVYTLAWSPDSALVAMGSLDGQVIVKPVFVGEPATFDMRSDRPVTQVEWSPDGRYLAAAAGDRVRVWDLDRERQLALGCSSIRANLSRRDWADVFGHAEDYRETCPEAAPALMDLLAALRCERVGHCEIARAHARHLFESPETLWRQVGTKSVREGFEITSLPRRGFLAQLGLQRGDIVTHINEEPLLTGGAARRAIAAAMTRGQAEIRYDRGGDVRELVVRVVD